MADLITVEYAEVPGICEHRIIVQTPITTRSSFPEILLEDFDRAIREVKTYDHPEDEWFGAPFA